MLSADDRARIQAWIEEFMQQEWPLNSEQVTVVCTHLGNEKAATTDGS